MTFGKGVALVIGFVGAVALGFWIGAYVTHDRSIGALTTPPAYQTESPQAAPKGRPSASATRVPGRVGAPVIAPSAPSLQTELKPLLNKGANMTMAADGFRDAQQFAAVAHAARNTEVPFVLLKHRVLDQGKTLAAAISESKPDVNADVEATRAQAEARSDLARLAG